MIEHKDIIIINHNEFICKGQKTWFISLVNVLGAFVNIKGMTNHSYSSSLS